MEVVIPVVILMIKAKVHLCPACQAPAAMPSSLATEIDVKIGVRCTA